MNNLVPTLKQKNEHYGCTWTSLRMLMNYYGDNISEKEMLKGIDDLGDSKIGTLEGTIVSVLTKGAIFAKLKGYDVDCYTYNFNLLSFSIENFGQELMRKYFSQFGKIEKKSMSDNDKIIFDSYSDLLDYDARLLFKMPDLKDVKQFLNNGVPVLLMINTASFYEKNISSSLSHAIVATGFRDEIIFYNDPADGKKHEVNEKKLIYSMSLHSCNNSAYLLAITPGSKK